MQDREEEQPIVTFCGLNFPVEHTVKSEDAYKQLYTSRRNPKRPMVWPCEFSHVVEVPKESYGNATNENLHPNEDENSPLADPFDHQIGKCRHPPLWVYVADHC